MTKSQKSANRTIAYITASLISVLTTNPSMARHIPAEVTAGGGAACQETPYEGATMELLQKIGQVLGHAGPLGAYAGAEGAEYRLFLDPSLEGLPVMIAGAQGRASTTREIELCDHL